MCCSSSSWQELLADLAKPLGLALPNKKRDDMSYAEFFDILDLARPPDADINLQRRVCDLMKSWAPSDHHAMIVGWAKRHRAPIITVNFDENLSKAVDAQYHLPKTRRGFTDWYPWSSYFSDREINDPRRDFAIWLAHGMMRYARSIRLGLTHYMGSVQRARSWVYREENSLRALLAQQEDRVGGGRIPGLMSCSSVL